MAALVLVSGGFDPYHKGHAEYIQKASAYGNVIVALNSDAWLMRKKGYVFMSYEDRKKVLLSIKGVVSVYEVDDSDDTVCEAIRVLRPDYFAKGGDRTAKNTPEVDVCKQLNVSMLFGLGEKISSSSDLVSRDWGWYEVLYEDRSCKIKVLNVNPHSRTSLQKHKSRNEHWIFPDDRYEYHKSGDWHQLKNDSDNVLKVIEVQTGSYFGEDDIERA